MPRAHNNVSVVVSTSVIVFVDSPALLSLHSEFLNLVEKANIDVISFVETKATFLPSLRMQFRFVPTESAGEYISILNSCICTCSCFLDFRHNLHFSDLGIGEFFEIPQDHLCICKPCSR